MDFQALKTAYTAQHWRSIDDTARMHLTGFAAFCEGAQAAEASHAEPEGEPAPEAPAITPESVDPAAPSDTPAA